MAIRTSGSNACAVDKVSSVNFPSRLPNSWAYKFCHPLESYKDYDNEYESFKGYDAG